jgi:hypothetical protein
MKPVDFRNETFNSLQGWINGSRGEVYAAWAKHGPGTTDEVCARWSDNPRAILSFRPRTTELFQLGFVCLDEAQGSAGSGVYRVRTQPELAAWLAEQHRTAANTQRELALG